MANEWYRFLMEFTKGTTPYRGYLVRKYSEEMVLEALDKKYIVACGKTEYNETKYSITALGKKVRDE